KETVALDLREEIRRGGAPFAHIMKAVSALSENEDLLLLAPFEPVPLFAVLAKQGFGNSSRKSESGDWEVRFSRELQNMQEGKTEKHHSQCGVETKLEVDARGLESPQPLVQILEALTNLSRGGILRARTDRRPLHLYPQLEVRGFMGETEEQQDGSYLTIIRHSR